MQISGERWRLGHRPALDGLRGVAILVAAVLPYALVTLYFAMVFVGYGLHGGDLEPCSVNGSDRHGVGGCPDFAGPLHANPWRAAVLRYQVWSGRFTVELAEYGLSHTLWLFVLITFVLSWLFLWSARSLLQIHTPLGLAAFAGLFFFIVPLQFHQSAGVYSTVIFYAWTAFLGVFAIAVIARQIRRESVSRAMVAASVAALCFALCSEQFVVAFAFAVGALAHQVVARDRRDLGRPLALYATLWAAAVANIVLCPGNALRKTQEIHDWIPQFSTMGPVEKLTAGLHHALYLLVTPSGSTVTLVALLAVAFLAQARASGGRASYLPGLGVVAWLVALVAVTASGGDIAGHAGATFAAVTALAVPAVLGGRQVTHGDRATRRLVLVLLVGGFSSAMLLSFSPTVWGSNTRTLLIEYLSLVAATFLLCRSAWRRAGGAVNSASGRQAAAAWAATRAAESVVG